MQFVKNQTQPIDQAVSPSVKQMDVIARSDLRILKKIGGGSFGTVHKATWLGSVVAVKEMNHISDDKSKELIREAEGWFKLPQHPHISRFIGICLEKPICLICEYFKDGSVLENLNNGFSIIEKFNILRQ
eukprot:UN32202